MRRKRLLVLIATVLLLATILTLHTFGVTGTGRRIQFETILKGDLYGYETSGYYVINDADRWATIRNLPQGLQPPPILPDVDFSKNTIIAAFYGFCPTSGYEIEIREIIDTGLTVVVKVQKTYPGNGCGVFDLVTYPYHIVMVDKTGKYILFDTDTSATQCG